MSEAIDEVFSQGHNWPPVVNNYPPIRISLLQKCARQQKIVRTQKHSPRGVIATLGIIVFIKTKRWRLLIA